MTEAENIRWIIDHMAEMVEQMGKMQENITWIIGQMIFLQEREESVHD